MRSSQTAVHSRLSRHSRRRRLMLASYESAANPSAESEYLVEQILLDPEMLEKINASAEALNLRRFSKKSLHQAASNLVSESATGSAVLADFPDIECEISPAIMQKKIQPASLDATSIFDDHESKENEFQSGENQPVNSDRADSTGSVSARHSTRNSLKKYLDNSPTVTTQGMQKIRGWLHDQQPRVWMFLGDETTAWLRHSGQPGFAEMFRHRLRWELRRFPDLIVNAGVQNASINELWKIGQQGLMQCRPDVAFILPGKSDCIQASKEPHRYAEKLRELAEFLRQNGTEPVFQTPPLINLQLDSSADDSLPLLCDLIREVAVVNHIPLIDHAEFWQEQTIQKDWVDSQKNIITQAGQSVLALLFFAELDIFDRSSELCGKLQNAWSDSPSDQPVNHPPNILQS